MENGSLGIHMDVLSQYSKLSRKQVAKDLRWFSRQNDDIRYEVFKLQKQKFFKLKQQFDKNEDMTLFALAGFELACSEIHAIFLNKKKKNDNGDLNSIKSLTGLRAKQCRTRQLAVKTEKLLNVKNVILKLIDKEKLSYRSVATYLDKFHKVSVSHALVGQVYKKIKEENKDDSD